MKVVLLISLMFTLALGKFNDKPCQPATHNNAYDSFLKKHILQKDFDRNSDVEWKKYLTEKKLCHRPRQTFMEKSDQGNVEQICQGSGWRYDSKTNLCISDSPIKVYDLTLDNNCQIKKRDSGIRYVVVACDAIDNVCRPVHFQTSSASGPDKKNKCSA